MSGGAMAEEEIDYESDPEDAKLSLKMRRREASDDEEEEEVEIGEKLPRRIDESDGESEGAAAEYEDELEEEEEDYDLDEEYVEEIEAVEHEESGGRGEDGVKVVAEERAEEGKDGVVTEELMEPKKGMNNEASEINDDNNNNTEDGQHEEEKKEIEPYAVPTAGAFYMHDDRFRDNAGGRNRRTLGGRKLWESKDDRKWGHDKFEELTVHERSYEECRRGPRGRYRGRGRNRGSDRGYARGHKPREHGNDSIQKNSNQINAPKGVRGRGPQRYQPSFRNNNEAPPTQNKRSGKSVEKPSYVSSVRNRESMSNAEPDVNLPTKQVFASNLNIASPPFYPSGSSTKDNSVPSKRDVQAGSFNRNVQPSVVGERFPMPQPPGVLRGKNIVDSIGLNKLHIDDSLSAVPGKPANTIQLPPSGTSINSTRQQMRSQGRGMTSLAQLAYQPAVSNNPVGRVAPPNQLQNVQRNPGQSHGQSSLQASGRQFTRVPSGSQASSPPNATGAVGAFESGELESPSESNKSKTALVAKGKGSTQGSGRGSFLHGGAQVTGATGNMSSGRGDQNFPTFLPVMQFGGQHPGGMGVPAVGMAFPGYVGQPQLGGNSEMTWLPVLAGAAGAMGASYCPPYIAMDGSYHARPSGHTSSITAASSKENNPTNVNNDWKPAQRPELSNDDFGQRQKNPRRYTEMKFDQ